MATIQALVEQNTFIIDHTEFNRTGDKVFINGHYYSDKPPLLSVAAAGAYAILHNVFQLTLDPKICVPDEDRGACRVFNGKLFRFTAFYWLTLIFIGGSSALLITLFWKALLDAGASGLLATSFAVVLGLASPIAPYSIVFAGHVLAAMCLFAGFYLLCQPSRSNGPLPQAAENSPFAQNDKRRLFFAGLLISFSVNIDLTLAVFIITFGLWVLITKRTGIIPFIIGALVPFAISAAINYWAAGTIVPLYFDPKAYDFFGTVLNTTVGGTNGFYSIDFGVQYTYNLLVGSRGLFAFTPVLLFGLIGWWLAIRDRALRLRGLTFAVIAGCFAFTLYLIFRTDNFGGEAWGTRWFVPLVPLLMNYVFVAFNRQPVPGLYPQRGESVAAGKWHIADRILHIAFWILVILSFATALYGLHDAWKSVAPIVRL